MASTENTLRGKQILVVEDELLVALLIVDMLEDEGCKIVGPFGTLESAVDAANHEQFDLALLDVNLAGQRVFPVADILSERQIPFMFLTGYGDNVIPYGKIHRKVCCKPFRGPELTGMMSATLADAHQ